MNNQVKESLQRIQDVEYWLEVHGLNESIFDDIKLVQHTYRDVFEQIKLFEDK